MSHPNKTSHAARILLVEDESMLLMLLADALSEQGYSVRTAARLGTALEIARSEEFDAAVLDVNLAGEEVFPLARSLRKSGVPFLFSTGYGQHAMPPGFRDHTVLQKPFTMNRFEQAVRAMLAHGRAPAA